MLCALAAATFLIHAVSPVTTSTDSAWTLHLAASILREGNVNLDEYRGLMDLSLDYRLRSIGGHIYYYYPAATPLLVTPAVVLANVVMPHWFGRSLYQYLDTHAPDDRTARLEKVIASFIVALASAMMYLIARRFCAPGPAVAIAAVFAFSTSMWSTASRALWQHGPSALLLALALYLVIVAPERIGAALGTGAILAFAYLVRPTNSISFAFFGLYYWLNHRRQVWAYVLGGIAILGPYVAQNWATYGNLFPPYSYQLFERLATPAGFAEALAGTLISPNRGLFIFSPIFLFAVYGAFRELKRDGLARTNLPMFLVGILLAHWVVTSLFEDWGGAWSIGPRYFVDVTPYLIFFLIPFAGALLDMRNAWRIVFLLAIAFSTFVQVRCSFSRYPFLWNGKPQALVQAPARKWDWGDLQFLRGLCRNDPLEGRAPACWTETIG